MSKAPLRRAVFSDGSFRETRGTTYTHALKEHSDEGTWWGFARSAAMVEKRRRIGWVYFEAVELRPVEDSQ